MGNTSLNFEPLRFNLGYMVLVQLAYWLSFSTEGLHRHREGQLALVFFATFDFLGHLLLVLLGRHGDILHDFAVAKIYGGE